MRILSSTPQVTKQATESKNRSRKSGKEVVGKTSGGQNIVRKPKPRSSLSASEIRAKLEEHKNPKKTEEATVKKPAFDTSINDDIAENMKRKSPIKKAAELDLARKKQAVQTKVEIKPKSMLDIQKPKEVAKAKEETPVEDLKQANLVNAQGEEIHSDIGKNSPEDPATQEKLKGLLKTNAFSFSQKEKDALASILNK
jgi:hypothetical protein